MRTLLVWLAATTLLVGGVVAGVHLLRTQDVDEPRSVTWDDYREVSGDLVVHKVLRPCDQIADAEVVETPRRVVVSLRVDLGGVCADLAVDRRTRVELDEPVGSRRVYDGVCLARGAPDRRCLRGPR